MFHRVGQTHDMVLPVPPDHKMEDISDRGATLYTF